MTEAWRRAQLELEFHSFWLAGTGRARGRHLDAVCHTDAAGLPAMPMSQIKGVVRETAERLAAAGTCGWTPTAVARLFGPRPDQVANLDETAQSGEGLVDFVGDAELSADVRQAFGSAGHRLVERIAGTEIGASGAASDKTLRYIEAAVPLRLNGRLEWRGDGEPDADWITLLDAACAATIAFGKNKNDGFGQSITRVVPVATADRSSNEPIPDRCIRVLMVQKRPAIFSKVAATEGAHQTMVAPTGAALLGWAAGNGRYSRVDDPFAVFHSGRVRFSDAVPCSADATATLPCPKNLMAPKALLHKAIVDGAIDTAIVRVGRPADEGGGTSNERVQYEALKCPFVTEDGRVVSPARGERLRTATRDGRASTGQLFGYQHLIGGHDARFQAEIEADETVSDKDWQLVVSAFAGQTLRIGRARGVGYGGEYECSVAPSESATGEALPAGMTRRVRILALSDLALIDDFGAATCHPTPEMFGLSDAGIAFDASDSAIGVRRFAPWNTHLRTRDVERQVIEAGSVLSFTLAHPLASPVARHQRVGLWREAGLGRVLLAPSILEGDRLLFRDRPPTAPTEQPSPVAPRIAENSYAGRLRAWADRCRVSTGDLNE